MIETIKRSPGRMISLGFLAVGVFLLVQLIMSIISFQLWAMGQEISDQALVSPRKSDQQVLGVSVQNKDNFPAFVSSLTRETQPNYDRFHLSVPKLNIDSEEVIVDTNELSRSLAHLPGSALPGEKGNVFISGHSSLSPLFSLQKAVFSKLPDMKKGDQIIIETTGSRFVYEVAAIKVVDPTDLSVLLPPDTQGRYISLMTCVPPGLNFKRLVVLGKMI